jgi:hypothetical protein
MPFRAWRIKVRQPITDPLVGSCIEVIDGAGIRIPLTVSATLRFAEWLSAGGIQEWRHQVSDLVRLIRGGRAELNRIRDERDEAKKRIETLEGELGVTADRLDHALQAMDEAIVGIKATSRFGKSIEAKRIREGLIEDLLLVAPPCHPRRLVYEMASGQAAAEAP